MVPASTTTTAPATAHQGNDAPADGDAAVEAPADGDGEAVGAAVALGAAEAVADEVGVGLAAAEGVELAGATWYCSTSVCPLLPPETVSLKARFPGRALRTCAA